MNQIPAQRWRLPSLVSLFEPNPVFKRELRARWRRPAAYLTLFFYAAPLALGMALFYGDFATSLSEERSLAVIGKELFDALILAQIIAWLFISAVTAAPTIAQERERGLLEALQLANLKASRIVWGKCLSLFSFQALLFLVPLPVIAICFLFGGVEPKSFIMSTVTIAITILCGTAIGLYFSSARPRPGPALRDALIFIVVWTALACLSATHTDYYNRWPLFIRQPLAVVEVIHPLSGLRWMGSGDFEWPARNLTDEEISIPYYSLPLPFANPALGPIYTPVKAQTAWQFFVGGIVMLSFFLFLLAARNTARILPEAEFVRRAKPEKRKSSDALTVSSAMPTRTERVLYYGLPLLSHQTFNNPVFGRELRGKMRWRAASPLMWVLRSVLLLAPLCFYLNWFLQDHEHTHYYNASRSGFSAQTTLLSLVMLCLYAAVVGATAFTRERESNTWENLRLSLLTPGQILSGKVWPLVIFLAVLSVPLFAILCLGHKDLLFYNDYAYDNSPVIPIIAYIPQTTALMFATALLVGSIALFISWLSRTTQLALGLSLAINAAWLFLFYLIADATPVYDTDSMAYLSWWNPLAAMKIMLMPQYPALQFLAFLCILFQLFVASILILIISALMRQKFRDEK